MNELKNLTNVVIGKLDKLVHKLFSRLFINFINYNIIIVQVSYISIKTKEAVLIGYYEFPDFHLSSHVEKETRYIQYGPFLLFQ